MYAADVKYFHIYPVHCYEATWIVRSLLEADQREKESGLRSNVVVYKGRNLLHRKTGAHTLGNTNRRFLGIWCSQSENDRFGLPDTSVVDLLINIV